MPDDQWREEVPEDPPSNALPTDDAAFKILFRQHFTPLCVYCQYQYSFDLDLAREAAHTAFIKLWETRQTLNSSQNIKAYLYKIVSITCVDIIRHRNVKRKYEKHVRDNYSDLDLGYDFNAADTRALQEAIDKAVGELPEKMKLVFELSRYEGLKYAQIAQRLNISVNTVETQMGRALVKLRQKLTGLYLILFAGLLLPEIIFLLLVAVHVIPTV
jgi:RNA polymerase sigma-70 factor (ECF subfamily)